MKKGWNILVTLLSLYGTCIGFLLPQVCFKIRWFCLNAVMQRPSTNREVFIFPASFNRSWVFWVLAALSEPAKSHRDNLKKLLVKQAKTEGIFVCAYMETLARWGLGFSKRTSFIVNTQWDRDEWWFNFVDAKWRFCFPDSSIRIASSTLLIRTSFNPNQNHKLMVNKWEFFIKITTYLLCK